MPLALKIATVLAAKPDNQYTTCMCQMALRRECTDHRRIDGSGGNKNRDIRLMGHAEELPVRTLAVQWDQR